MAKGRRSPTHVKGGRRKSRDARLGNRVNEEDLVVLSCCRKASPVIVRMLSDLKKWTGHDLPTLPDISSTDTDSR